MEIGDIQTPAFIVYVEKVAAACPCFHRTGGKKLCRHAGKSREVGSGRPSAREDSQGCFWLLRLTLKTKEIAAIQLMEQEVKAVVVSTMAEAEFFADPAHEVEALFLISSSRFS